MTKNSAELNLICMEDVEAQEIEYLWDPYIASGKVTIIQGDPGEGKSMLTIDIAAKVSRGELPEEGAEPGNVIYQNSEDGLADTIKPRLIKAGADCSKILVINEESCNLSMTDERLEKAIVKTNAKLVILDPLQAYLGEETDMNRANKVRAKLGKLNYLAEKYKCAIILVGHLNKGKGTKAVYRSLGSMDFPAAVRSVLLVGKVPGEENMKVMMQTKSNLSKLGTPQAFKIIDGAIEWYGDIQITEEDVLKSKTNSVSKKERVKELISETLAMHGSISSKEMFRLAEEEGIKTRTVEKAKKELGIVSEKVLNEWYWKLPVE